MIQHMYQKIFSYSYASTLEHS